MAQISRLKDAEISNGNLINADDLDAEYNALYNESNSQDTRLTNLESNAITIAGVKTFSSFPVTPSSAPTTDYQVANKKYVDDNLLSGFPARYQASAPPVYSSASQFTVAFIACRNSANDGNISKNTSSTGNMATTGLNGIAQSADLTGTASCSSTTVTGTGTSFLTDFQAGDVIWFSGGAARRITVVTNNTSMTVESSLTQSSTTYRRGGEAPNTWYNLYAITDNTTPGLILSTRSVSSGDTLVDLPTGYTKSRQMAFACYNNSSSDLREWVVNSGWPYRPVISWAKFSQDVPGTTAFTILSNTSSSWSSAQSARAFVPPVSRIGIFAAQQSATSGTGTLTEMRCAGTSVDPGKRVCGGSSSSSYGLSDIRLELNASQEFEYKTSNTSNAANIYGQGFVVTEVP